MRFNAAVAFTLFAAGLLVACDRKESIPASGSEKGQRSGAAGSSPVEASAICRGLGAGIKGSSAAAFAEAFESLAKAEPSALREARYTVVPAAGGSVDANALTINSTTFEFTAAGLRALDERITERAEIVDAPELASTLNGLDALLAGMMRSAAEQDAMTLYKMSAAWRAQVLTRLKGLGSAGEQYSPGERLERVRKAMTSQQMSRDVP